MLVLKAEALNALLLKRVKEGAEDTLLLELKSELKGILYYSSSSSFLFSLKRLAKERKGSDSLLNNLKLRKLNRI